MQTITVRTTHNVTVRYPVASVGDRVLACVIDLIIKVGYILLVGGALISLEVEIPGVYFVFLGLPWMLYHLLFEIFMNGQSPGKRVFRILVVRLDGTPPTPGDLILRWVFGLVDFYILTGLLALLIIAVGGNGQRIGDIVAGTCAVKMTDQTVPSFQSYVPAFPQVVQLEGSDIKLIQRAIEAFTEFENSQPAEMVAEKFKLLLSIQTSLSPFEFLNRILKDYNYLTAR